MSRAPKKLSPKPVLDRAWKPSPSADKTKAAPDREERVKVGDYLILTCPSCGQDTKLQSAYVGHRMGCGSCQAPLEIIEQEAEKPEKVNTKQKPQGHSEPLPRQPLVFRVLSDEDIAEESEREFSDEFERRRLPFEAPAWDDTDGAGASQPKKQQLTHKEQVFRHLTHLIMAVSLAAVAVILYSAVFKTVGVANTDDKTLEALPADVSALIDAALSEEKPLSAFLTSAEEQAALAIVNGFVNATSIESRLPFVRDPKRVRPLMEEWYAREGIVTEWPDGEIRRRDKIVDQDRYFIRLAIDFAGAGTRFFAIEQTKKDLKLDWETATGYQPTPLAEFQKNRPTTPAEFRVKLKPSDYYNYHFWDNKKYRAVELSYPGQPEFKLIGYFETSTAWGAELAAYLDVGNAPSLIVELKYPEGASAAEGIDQVEIISLLSDTWWL